MRVVLIGNYPPDNQESMQRFAHMLATGFRQAGVDSEIWQPGVFFARGTSNTNAGVGKWLAYLDKWVVFPLALRKRLRKINNIDKGEIKFHICDHSNAPYLSHLPATHTSITCHDVLAIRGGLGYADAHVGASRLGKVLQTWIFNNLRSAKKVAAVSKLTLDQLEELAAARANDAAHKNWRVIHNAFNADFRPMDAAQIAPLLGKAGSDFHTPFLLHVGSGLARKNRRLLLDMVALLGDKWQGNICFAGEPVDDELMAHAESLGLQRRVISVKKPDHETLVALYSACTAFVFPSFSEGFGWPIIEAQACGAPVIVSNIAPMPEVSGGAALHASPSDAQAFADAFQQLMDDSFRASLIQKGYDNCRRFKPSQMIDSYVSLLESSPA